MNTANDRQQNGVPACEEMTEPAQGEAVQTNGRGGEAIRVRGVVQGVGFRPFVVTLAGQAGLFGRVWNDAEGVMIHAWGEPEQLEAFAARLSASAPPLARIEAVEVTPLDTACEDNRFSIIDSAAGETNTGVAADAALCAACLHELLDPEDRRYRYPFINCTHCGPRLSIIHAVPYDRASTSMAVFTMCPVCQMEYDDWNDRRFHAQPNACPECGPYLWLEYGEGGGYIEGNIEAERGTDIEAADPIRQAAGLIRSGAIVAIKGIGGFHLVCDATNSAAVQRLRQRKRRYHKPFALMAGSVGQIGSHAQLTEKEQALLESVEAPIVLLAAKADHPRRIAAEVAPMQGRLGFMLPYTPIHHLLMLELDDPVVMTSGNASDEPQCIDNSDAMLRLEGVADAFLLHDREIVNRLDDAVIRVAAGRPRLLRRGRGFAPGPIRLPEGFDKAAALLAMGGELKNSFCIISNGHAILSQHMGDLENSETLRDYYHNLDLYRQLYDFKPEQIAVDLHPDYLSGKRGREMAAGAGSGLIEVQHHHAHIAAVMAEHGLAPGTQVLGVALDGLGMGEGGELWGGEFLLAGYAQFQRLGSIQKVAMIGGARAIREPWRSAYAHLHALGWNKVLNRFPGLDIIHYLNSRPLGNLNRMIERGVNAPMASSSGRLFDAVAAVLGICREYTAFEGEAAMALEAVAEAAFDREQGNAYPVSLIEQEGVAVIQWQPMWMALLADLASGVSAERIAARFHHSFINAVADQAQLLAKQNGMDRIVLGGGVFQNALLLEGVTRRLSESRFRVLAPEMVPANDGGLAFGQAAVAAAR
ncbi:MAG: carbamoyltransferase HypF [Mariprofundaceae bacterium]|nr:carbamoyltransferase HypF [Mariprofundaceae bacterium]